MEFNDFRRIIKTAHHEEPDRVPLIESLIDYKIQSQFLGEEVAPSNLKGQVAFYKLAGYDYVPLPLGLVESGEVTNESNIAKALEGGFVEGGSIHQLEMIESQKDLEKMDWDKLGAINLSSFHRITDYLPQSMRVIGITGKVFTLTWMLMGFEHFCASLYTDPELVEGLLEKIAKIQITAIEKAVKLKQVGAIWVVDDVAFGTGLILSKNHIQSLLFPFYKEIIRLCKENEKLVFMHSDGLILPLMEDLIHIGFDGIHPIDPSVPQLDIKEIKKIYGDRIALFGNVDVELLAKGSEDEVQDRVFYLLKHIAPGGGYCLGSGNSVPSWANYDNYKIMVETTLKYGSYPISLSMP